MGLFDLFKKKKPAGADAEPGAPETAAPEIIAPEQADETTGRPALRPGEGSSGVPAADPGLKARLPEDVEPKTGGDGAAPLPGALASPGAPASLRTEAALQSPPLPSSVQGRPPAQELAGTAARPTGDSPPTTTAPNPAPATPTPAPPSRLRAALNRTRQYFTAAFTTGTGTLVDADYYDGLADALVLADVGMELSQRLVQRIKAGMNERGLLRRADVPPVAGDVITAVLTEGVRAPQPLDPGQLAVILLIGVNGSGKTTLTAKLAARLKGQGLRVLLAAADTFRAAAVDQLKVWAGRTGVDIVAGQEGADPAAVVFDAAQAARARGFDVLLVDTAGRLQTKKNLMEELSKVVRTVDKACPGANIAHLLVLDATVGQNALSQAQLFNECCPVTGVALTKLDGTAKGGAVLAVVDALKAPVLYCGVGEAATDLADFDAREFALGLVGEE